MASTSEGEGVREDMEGEVRVGVGVAYRGV